MNRKIILCLMTTALLSIAPFVAAQQSKKVPVIGYLTLEYPSPATPSTEAFRQGLRDLGYVEGKNIHVEYRFADEKIDRLSQLAAELVRLNPDVIVTSTTPGVLAAKKATTTIPIVVGAAGDLVQRGVVASLARPGGNITGLTFIGRELAGKRLELLKEVAPKLTRVAYLVNPANPAWDGIPKDLEDESGTLGIRVYRVEARGVDEYEAAFSVMTKSSANALHLANDLIFTNISVRHVSE